MGEELQSVTPLVFENRPGQINYHEVLDERLSFSNNFSPGVKRHRATRELRHARVRVASGRGRVRICVFLLSANTLPDLVYGYDINAVVKCPSWQISKPATSFSFQAFEAVRARRGIQSKNNFGSF